MEKFRVSELCLVTMSIAILMTAGNYFIKLCLLSSIGFFPPFPSEMKALSDVVKLLSGCKREPGF